jgi:hypothetical protein
MVRHGSKPDVILRPEKLADLDLRIELPRYYPTRPKKWLNTQRERLYTEHFRMHLESAGRHT